MKCLTDKFLYNEYKKIVPKIFRINCSSDNSTTIINYKEIEFALFKQLIIEDVMWEIKNIIFSYKIKSNLNELILHETYYEYSNIRRKWIYW